MTRGVPVRIVSAVLALYPAAIRHRYGAEIADLLVRSSRPWRDLADVTWCALLDRGGSVTAARLRPHVSSLTGLFVAPAVFGFALFVFDQVGTMLFAALGALTGHGSIDFQGGGGVAYSISDGFAVAGSVAAVAMAAAVAVWWARVNMDLLGVPAPAVAIPALLTLGSMATAGGLSVFTMQFLGTRLLAAMLATACWWPATTLLAVRVARLTRLGRATAARRLSLGATLAVLPLPYAVYHSVHPRHAFPSELTFLSVPAVLTTCTVFTFTLLAFAARRGGATSGRTGRGTPGHPAE